MYLAAGDADATAAAVTASGGKVIVPPIEVGDKGVMAIAADTGGAGIGIWQLASHKGFGLHAEAGAPGWSVYFGVNDADATLAAIESNGGAIVDPAEDTPYGRLATATDRTGARFKLVQG